MKINREALLAGLRGRIILSDEEYNTIIDALEDTHKSYSEKIIECNVGTSTEAITEDAIDRGYDASSKEWREMALEVVYNTCMTNRTFTANTFRKKLKESGIETHDNRAVGGLMQTAKSRKWCKPTGNSITSKVGHFSPLQVWESRIYCPSL